MSDQNYLSAAVREHELYLLSDPVGDLVVSHAILDEVAERLAEALCQIMRHGHDPIINREFALGVAALSRYDTLLRGDNDV